MRCWKYFLEWIGSIVQEWYKSVSMFPCSCTQLEHKLVETFSFCDSLLWGSRAECTEKSIIPKLTLGFSIVIYNFDRARISLIRIFNFGYSNSDVVRKSIPSLPYNMKPSGLLYNFFLLVKMDLRGDSLDLLRSHTLHNAKLPCNLSMYTWKC